VHHRTNQINHQPDATIFQFNYPDIYIQLYINIRIVNWKIVASVIYLN